ncbi:MAG: MCE family protein, partial [Acidovorax sp.]|nr:MCE family protein [Acidovorax sp.]
MENKAHALAAGVFLILVSTLLAALTWWLTRDNTHYTLYELSSKESVSGLSPQAAVRYKGVAV